MKLFFRFFFHLVSQDSLKALGIVFVFLVMMLLEISGLYLFSKTVGQVFEKNAAALDLELVGQSLILPVSVLCFFVLLIYLAKALTSFLSHYLIVTYSQILHRRLRQHCVEGILEGSSYFNRCEAGEASNMTIYVSGQLSNLVRATLKLLADLLIAFAIICLISIQLGVVMVLGGFGFCIAIYIFDHSLKNKLGSFGQGINESMAKMLTLTREIWQFSLPIRANKDEEFFKNKFNTWSRVYEEAQVSSQLLEITPRLVMELVLICVIVSVVAFMAVETNSGQSSNIEEITLGVGAGLRLLGLFNIINSSLNQVRVSRNSLEKFQFFEEYSPSCINETRASIFTVGQERQFRSIVFSDVSFKYPDGYLVLDRLRFTITEGDFFLIQGRSGSGKSTILKLLCGFESPCDGAIEYDGKKLDKTRKLSNEIPFSFVTQDSFVFDGSILSNVVMQEDFSSESEKLAKEALVKAGLALSELGNLYDHRNDFAGQLSGGQKQRLCIARAIFTESKLLICDEPTAALDEENEQHVFELLARLNKEHQLTVIVVSHSPLARRYATKTLVLDLPETFS